VSIGEVLTSKASIQCWDNATRGLDANTALQYTQVMRDHTDVDQNATIISLYQAGNGIYSLFDKVTVIAEGRVLYYGPRSEAREYFEALGFEHGNGANTADYLTAVTATNERKIKDGFEHVPTTPAEFAEIYAKSDVARRMRAELDEHLQRQQETTKDTEDVQRVVQMQKSKWAAKKRPEKVDYFTQVKTALIRDYQRRWGDKYTFWARQATTLLQALICGSLFYNIPDTTNGIFLRGGTLFLSLLFPALISLSETTAAFSGRAVLAKHKAFSMYRPSAVALAETIGDFPIIFVQMVIFTLIIYFMTGLQVSAGHYFEYLLFVYVSTLTMTAFFRFVGYSFGTFNDASKVSGLLFSIFVTVSGPICAAGINMLTSQVRWIHHLHALDAPLVLLDPMAQSGVLWL
jgi:ABC-type multidrug transport system permease subunit